jgi:exodeoxyribonuclease V alpha subunit
MPIIENPELTAIDRHFAEFIAKFGGGEVAAKAAERLSQSVRQNHICLSNDFPREGLEMNRAVGGPDDGKPLVLDQKGRLYLRRYFEYEQRVATAILTRCDGAKVAAARDDQQLAVNTAVARRFTIISGGPGTGKTTTVAKILVRIADSAPSKPRIFLAAPTGKAAARLTQRVREEIAAIECKHPEWIQLSASTIHRLLGVRGDSIYFRHDARNPLPADVIIVDEASMVSLPLMAKLLDALPDKCKVILLGDRDQLASVEPGYVLGDVAAAAKTSPRLQTSLVVLRKNYRFRDDSGIYALCNAARDGDFDAALNVLRARHSDVTTAPTPSPAELSARLREPVLAHYREYLSAHDPAQALELFSRFRILTPLRRGAFGVTKLNQIVEEILRAEGLIDDRRELYQGLPVLITQNDYDLKLYNGDTGILSPDYDNDGQLAAWFEADGKLRRVPPARLPEHEKAFVTTVHKAQGSEFERVLFILPPEESPVVTRELIYTALSRARSNLEIWCDEPVFESAINDKTERSSGLRERLSGAE